MPEDVDRPASSASIPAMGLQGAGVSSARPQSLHLQPSFPRAERPDRLPTCSPRSTASQGPAYLSHDLTGQREVDPEPPNLQHPGFSSWAALALGQLGPSLVCLVPRQRSLRFLFFLICFAPRVLSSLISICTTPPPRNGVTATCGSVANRRGRGKWTKLDRARSLEPSRHGPTLPPFSAAPWACPWAVCPSLRLAGCLAPVATGSRPKPE